MKPKRLLGIILVLLGLLYGMGSLELLPEAFNDLIFRWELLLIGSGIFFMATEKKGHTGLILCAIGILFWLPDAFDLPEDIDIWPFLLLLIGLYFLLPSGWGSKKGGSEQEGKDLRETVIFGNSDKILNTHAFRGGDIQAIFGETHIDLTRCRWGPGEREIEVFFFFGGGTIHVPSEWELDIQVTPIFGSFSDKRSQKVEGSAKGEDRVRIKGICLFGEGKIRE
ncbi:MAG: hypothetical protein ABEH38_01865 [Flavobacteriales bacterium]